MSSRQGYHHKLSVREAKNRGKEGNWECDQNKREIEERGKNKIGRRLIEKNVGWVFIHIAVTKV